MSTIQFREHRIYVEVHGSGDPLVVLNGIMMSTKSWTPFVKQFSQHNQVILLDFLDQGQSSSLAGIEFNHDIQVEALHAVITQLDLTQVSLFGISYGGEIAIQYALKYPQRLKNLLLFNTTAWTSPWLQEVGNAWNYASADPYAYYATTIPVIYSPQFYAENIAWIQQRKAVLIPVFSDPKFISAMVRLTNSSVGYDKRDEISAIEIPTLIVGSEYDFVTPLHEQKYLAQTIPNASFIQIPDCGHASMYEKPDLFLSLVLGFIIRENQDFII